MASIQFFFLGAPRIISGGQEISIQRRKTLAMIAYLAVTGKAHSRDTLAAVFWPDHNQTRARANLRHELFEIKAIINADLLLVDREQVSLNPALAFWSDVSEFKNRIDTARTHHPPPQRFPDFQPCPACKEQVERALSLYSGDFLKGFSLPDCQEFNDWQFLESETLRKAAIESLAWISEWHSCREEFGLAVDYARRRIGFDPMNEPAHRHLMKLYAAADQQSAALRQYQECARILAEELGIEPEPETKELYESIRTRKISAVKIQPLNSNPETKNRPSPDKSSYSPHENKRLHNLPVKINPFIGRKAELSQIDQLLTLDPTCRCLTLTGPGGSGKTRLAVEAALRMTSGPGQDFSDGTWFVSLADLIDPGEIVPAIAKSFNFSFLTANPDERRQQLLDLLRSKKMLLILDNFEHLIRNDSVALVIEILGLAPGIKILITSRERINIQVERVLPVSGLKTPPRQDAQNPLSLEEISEYSAVQFFCECGRRILPGFKLVPANLPAIIQICEIVAGMPLAIELAASWLEVFSAVEILDEIRRNLDFLETDWRDLPQRQRSIRAVLNSSWNLLGDDEKTALKSLAVFRGTFSHQGFQAVSGYPVSILAALLHKSWLQRNEAGRFAVHPMVRQYAYERLSADVDLWDQVKDKHSSYFAGALDQLLELIKGSRQNEAFQIIDVEYDNIQDAWQRLVEEKQVGTIIQRMLLPMFFYSEVNSSEYDFLRLVSLTRNSVDDQNPEAENQACILLTAQAAFFKNGISIRDNFGCWPLTYQEEFLIQAWSRIHSIEDLKRMNFWGIFLAYLSARFHHPQTSLDVLNQLAEHYQRIKLDWERALSLVSLAQLYMLAPCAHTPAVPPIEIRNYLNEALLIYQKLGNVRESSLTQAKIGEVYFEERNLPAAIESWKTALAALDGIGHWTKVSGLEGIIGVALLEVGEFEQGLIILNESSQDLLSRGYKRDAATLLSLTSRATVRYGVLETAIQQRLQSLALSIEVGDLHGEAWSSWELGESYRVGGNYALALEWFEKANALFIQEEEYYGPIFIQRGLGDIAGEQGNYLKACVHFKESLRLANLHDHHWAEAYALCGLGRSAAGLKLYAAAMDYFLEAARLVKQQTMVPLALAVISGVSNILMEMGKIEAAVELASFTESQPLCWKEFKTQAKRVIAAGASLSLARLSAALKRGRKREIWTTIDQIIEGSLGKV